MTTGETTSGARGGLFRRLASAFPPPDGRGVALVFAFVCGGADLFALWPAELRPVQLGSAGAGMLVVLSWNPFGGEAVKGRLRWAVRLAGLLAVVFFLERCWVGFDPRFDSGDGRLRDSVDQTYRFVSWFFAVLAPALRFASVRNLLGGLRLSPVRVLAASFGGAIVAGTLFLALPQATVGQREIRIVDALFDATSAVCVTGLSAADPGSDYSRAGQVALLLLMQAGGLGIMTFSALAIWGGGRDSYVRHQDYREMLGLPVSVTVAAMLRTIFLWTFVAEATGGLVLWSRARGAGVEDPAFWALFHSVSAFCNAGFSLHSDSLARFSGDPVVLLVVGLLVVIGGLGFPVLRDLRLWGVSKILRRVGREVPRHFLAIHSRIVLGSNALLWGLGGLAFLVIEWRGSFAGMGPFETAGNALFQSVSARTAGFSTVDFSGAAPATLLFTIVLMFVGASPASAGGGIKVTTLVTMVAALRSVARGRPAAEIFGRELPAATVRRALALVLTAAAIVLGATFSLLLVERADPLKIAFETTSAFATVGFSAGVTPELSAFGRLVLVGAMFVGRLGPLAAVLVFSGELEKSRHRFPEEDVLLG